MATGSDERKIAKIPKLGADCICLDCEDGVASTKKGEYHYSELNITTKYIHLFILIISDEARVGIRKVLDLHGSEENRKAFFGNSEFSIRVNSVESGLCEHDIDALLRDAQNLPQAIHLPKVDEPGHLSWFYDKVANALPDSRRDQEIGLIMFIESARALIRLPEICEEARLLSRTGYVKLVPEALVFGSDDFVADIGAVRTKEAHELVYARQKLVAVAKAYEMQAIDLVFIDYKDLDGLRLQSEEGARMGFTGKQVIHPGQVSVVQTAFSPSPEKVEWATQLIEEFREHENSGKGAFNFRGHMIDMPLVKQAQNIVDMKDKL